MNNLELLCECMNLDFNHFGNPLGNDEYMTFFYKYTGSSRDISFMRTDCNLYDEGRHEILETGTYWKVVEYFTE